MNEEDGTTVEQAEKLCKHALPLMIGNNDNIWCALSSLVCYKTLDETCENEEFDIQPIV